MEQDFEKIIADFESETGYGLEIRDGKPYHITGACSPGTRDYIANRLPKPHKAKYSIGEIITLTDGEYKNKKFKEFFN